MFKFLLTLEYDGSDFHGWIEQPKTSTIQGELNKAISRVTKNAVFKTIGASKTDTGVHAIDQKVLLDLGFNPKLDLFKKAINKALPETIKVRSIEEVKKDFNIRDVLYKEYSYTINDKEYNILSNRFELNWDFGEIDIDKLQNIFNLFIGEHEFKLFSGLNHKELDSNKITTIREIESINVKRALDKVVITFKAKGFIRYQIRMVVQSALNCYLNKKISADEIKEKLQGKGNKPPFNAPAKGLKLNKIVFKT
ncbi:tRNA pseudouridine synthase A [Mesoplasma florum W37]|uniref:tRNA pseudouridine synthase A n=1 Tax=Mesoplasma florum TaxID=2151 RepID=A0AAD0HT37_MESFO|nr:tRNA pseudouridine(38-40) synthase TruA [Mesoplasma florum]AGY41227.1 tRNA pseudouridine synthase A [Mesoplasma florum W37]AVN59457.1 tRNA pseudouridine(38-40) synthase TruA [Mesoplasma florum]AVN65565.1 tRNA pseudouridine synthase A [Mesoplasma florum]